MNLDRLQKNIQYTFKSTVLLRLALTHPSLASKQKVESYDKLEFLGNGILGAVLADMIFNAFPKAKEGEMSVILSKLASTSGIVDATKDIGIGQYILIDTGEEKNKGRENPNNIENCIEALIGAIYLDGGYEKAKDFIVRFWSKKLTSTTNTRDPKSRLQEICQQKLKTMPIYSLISQDGPIHAPVFTISCKIKHNSEEFYVDATDRTKKSAEKEAAIKMLDLLDSYSSL
jgi:ribonuclease-3